MHVTAKLWLSFSDYFHTYTQVPILLALTTLAAGVTLDEAAQMPSHFRFFRRRFRLWCQCCKQSLGCRPNQTGESKRRNTHETTNFNTMTVKAGPHHRTKLNWTDKLFSRGDVTERQTAYRWNSIMHMPPPRSHSLYCFQWQAATVCSVSTEMLPIDGSHTGKYSQHFYGNINNRI